MLLVIADDAEIRKAIQFGDFGRYKGVVTTYYHSKVEITLHLDLRSKRRVVDSCQLLHPYGLYGAHPGDRSP